MQYQQKNMSSKIIQLCPNMSKLSLFYFLSLHSERLATISVQGKSQSGCCSVLQQQCCKDAVARQDAKSAKSVPICSGIQLLPHELLLCLRQLHYRNLCDAKWQNKSVSKITSGLVFISNSLICKQCKVCSNLASLYRKSI